MTSDAVFFDRAVRRIHWAMLWLTIAIAVFVFFWGGWPWVVGYLAGAVASMFNFRWLHQLVSTLGQDARRPRKRLVLFLALRYLLLVLCGYVIVKCFGLNLAAAVSGLFVAVAAVILEIIYELIYART